MMGRALMGLADQAIEPGLVDIGGDDGCASLGQFQRTRASDTRSSAGYQRSRSCNLHGKTLPFGSLLLRGRDRKLALCANQAALRSPRGEAPYQRRQAHESELVSEN